MAVTGRVGFFCIVFIPCESSEVKEGNRVRHDRRHPFTVIDGFGHSRQYEKLTGYIAQYKTFWFCRCLNKWTSLTN